MPDGPATRSWFDHPRTGPTSEPAETSRESERPWLGFMTARATLGLMLLLFQATLYELGQAADVVLIVLCAGYFAAALAVRLRLAPRTLRAVGFGPPVLLTVGLDILFFAALQFLQGSLINYSPLLMLPVLLAAVLGTLPLALGTAATVTLLLLAHAAWLVPRFPLDMAPLYLQAALTSTGCFVVAVLAHQLSARLANQELRARQHQSMARLQQQINALVIESMNDGVVVIDPAGQVQALNPAARHMLHADDPPRLPPFGLDDEPGWRPLADFARDSLARQQATHAQLTIRPPLQGPRRLQVHTRLTPSLDNNAPSLCVMFLRDLRELEARLRTEKLASMGRMSVAVAHEIRNPLTAIAQANALLEEQLTAESELRLTQLVQQNARRLERIVEDILDLARVRPGEPGAPSSTLELNTTAALLCHDWAEQTASGSRLALHLSSEELHVHFDPEHLRRVLVNLLDNARRHASQRPDAIQVATRISTRGMALLTVWSDSAPMELSVERHLFEPFFSSESRSSGLGLYICRELCEGHGAFIGHRRTARTIDDAEREGNEFFVSLRWARDSEHTPAAQPTP